MHSICPTSASSKQNEAPVQSELPFPKSESRVGLTRNQNALKMDGASKRVSGFTRYDIRRHHSSRHKVQVLACEDTNRPYDGNRTNQNTQPPNERGD